MEDDVSGHFITIEGGEGVGKSTQARLLAERIRETGLTVVEVREPGGTPTGDRIREILLDPAVTMTARTELFLYEAARAELTATVIVPALSRGEIVVCDRFFDSSTAYQGHGRGLNVDVVRTLNLAATAGVCPDLTILLQLETAEALRRATTGGADRIEAESLEFHRAVIEGFAILAADDPARIVAVDASGTVDEVAARVWNIFNTHPVGEHATDGWPQP
ncbi:MAG TPA: dTMP kinase [Coriobacteriia bacterium]